MKSMYKFLILLFLLCNVEHNYGQDSEDHLQPVGSIYDIYNYEFEYYSKVRKVLFKELTDSPSMRFQVMASFTPEHVLDIDFDKDNSKYYMIYHICEEEIWYNEKWEKIKVKKFKTEIDKESFELIKSLFSIAIAQTKFPENEIIGFDGADYYFSINKFGLKSGTVWSPPSGTKMRKLVDIGYELIKLTQSEKELVKIDNDLRTKIETLIEEFK